MYPNSETIWERHGAVVCKRNRVDILRRLKTMHERDRQADNANSNIDRNRPNCFPAMSFNNNSSSSIVEFVYRHMIVQESRAAAGKPRDAASVLFC